MLGTLALAAEGADLHVWLADYKEETPADELVILYRHPDPLLAAELRREGWTPRPFVTTMIHHEALRYYESAPPA